MKKIIDFFISKSLVVNLFTALVVFVGSFSIYTLQKDIFPQVEFDVILVRTFYPGSTAEDVEKLVSLSIERSLKEVDGIKELNILSAEGSSIGYLTIEPDADIKEVEDDIKTAIDSIDDFPEEVKDPTITSLSNKNRRGIIKVVVKGAEYERLRVVSKDLRDLLELNKSISIVDIQGYREDEIVALVDPAKIQEKQVTLGEISRAIDRSNLNLSAGKFESDKGDVFVRTLNEFEDENDVANVVVRSNSEGQSVLVKDVAKVVKRPVDDGSFGRSNGDLALFLDVRIKSSADIIRSSDWVKGVVADFFANPKYKDVAHSFVDDSSYFVKRRLNVLRDNGILGIGLVFICLLLFLNTSTSIVTSMGAPIAFMIAFICMDFMGLSINLISMFGLILVLGMLVDDSIIVAEQFYQNLEEGDPPKEAARKAAYQTIKPVTATIVTTMIAFGALFFMGGIMGKFLWPVPATVIICLIASWFECFFILPSHLADFVKLKKNKASEYRKQWYLPFKKMYGSTLKIVLKAPTITNFTFFLMFVGSIFVATKMNFELFPGDDVRTVFVQFKGKVGTAKEETSKEMLKVEKMIVNSFPKNEVQQIQARIGILIGDQGTKTGSHYGSIVLYLTDPTEREKSTDEIIKKVTDRAEQMVDPNFKILVKKVQGGPPRGKDVDIEIFSDSIEELKIVSKKIEKALSKEAGVVTTEIDFEEGNDQVIFKVDEAEALRLGLSVRDIGLELRRALSGDEITQIRKSDEDIEIKIKLDEEIVKTAEPLLGLTMLNSSGRLIPLNKVAQISSRPGAFVIRRLDRKRTFSISGTLDKAQTNSTKIATDFNPKLENILKDYPGITFNFGGENEDTQESMQGLLKSFVIAMSCIFIVLVLMFNSIAHPLSVMTAIPLGMIGVIWSFKLFGLSLGFMAMMGVVGLIGVVINDSIVLVNFINLKREEYESMYEAIFEACISRLRPVLLTTFTTVAGLLPVAHARGGDPFLKPMAMSFAWGLAFATFVTLVFVPCQYLIFEKIKNFFRFKNKVELGHALDIKNREAEALNS